MDTRCISIDQGQAPSAPHGRRAHAQRAPAADAAPVPPKVIRGTSTSDPQSFSPSPKTQVDYLTISCEENSPAIRRCLSEVFHGSVAGPVYETGPGLRHFERSQRITIAGMPAGVVLTGGETQRGRACIDLSGVGCSFVADWRHAEEALLDLPGRSWRRADIAADFFRGEITHERVKRAHEDGKFKRGGRGPVMHEILSSDEKDGRTIYIGVRGGDALGRFYEKGKKEFRSGSNKALRKLADSPHGVSVKDSTRNDGESFDLAAWYRAELELRATNRPIPDDWISRRDEYFAGTYPFLQELLPEVEGRILIRPRDKGIIAIEQALERVKRQWGAVLFTGLAYCGGDYVALCVKILGNKHSPRLIEGGALLAIADE